MSEEQVQPLIDKYLDLGTFTKRVISIQRKDGNMQIVQWSRSAETMGYYDRSWRPDDNQALQSINKEKLRIMHIVLKLVTRYLEIIGNKEDIIDDLDLPNYMDDHVKIFDYVFSIGLKYNMEWALGFFNVIMKETEVYDEEGDFIGVKQVPQEIKPVQG